MEMEFHSYERVYAMRYSDSAEDQFFIVSIH